MPASPDPSAASPAWEDVKACRRERRKALIARRQAMGREERERLRDALIAHISTNFPELARHTVGFYWPIQGEPDLRHLMGDLIGEGARACLPVVVEKRRPVEFWAWHPRMRMEPGDWNIPQPRERHLERPTALLVPLVGFGGFYRLGYGAGYYDRTLAALDPKPFCIGVGLEIGRLETIHPQPHDIPMDAIVTEDGVWTAGGRDRLETPARG